MNAGEDLAAYGVAVVPLLGVLWPERLWPGNESV